MDTLVCKREYEAGVAATRDRRMKWWREARFGMFVHYGIYAQLGACEWAQVFGNYPVEEYEKLAETFSVAPGAPREWVKFAKAAGAKYMVLTTRHHDGFPCGIRRRTPIIPSIMARTATSCANTWMPAANSVCASASIPR